MKSVWIAIAFLGLCVLAIGGTLIRQQPSAAAGVVPLTGAQAMVSSLAGGSGVAGTVPVTKQTKEAPSTNAGAATKPASTKAAPVKTAASPAATPAESTPMQSSAPTCASCGTVEAVTPITRQGQASGVGMVGGAVVGGVLGNQVGKGSGRTAATVLGAVGGGWAGNSIEKNMKKTTVYSVRVRMQDGSSRVIEQQAAPMVGAKVTVNGSTLRPA